MNCRFHHLLNTRQMILLKVAWCIHYNMYCVSGSFSSSKIFKKEKQIALLGFLANLEDVYDNSAECEAEAIRI